MKIVVSRLLTLVGTTFMLGAALAVARLPAVAHADEHRIVVGIATSESLVLDWWHFSGTDEPALDLTNNAGATGGANICYTSFAWNGTAGMIAVLDPYPGTCTGTYVRLYDGFFNVLDFLRYTHIQPDEGPGDNWLVYGGSGTASSEFLGTILTQESTACTDAGLWSGTHLHQGGGSGPQIGHNAGLQTYVSDQGHPDVIFNLDYFGEWLIRAFAPDLDSIPPSSDNCPTVTNQSQVSFDADGPPFGNGVGIGNGKGMPGHDATTPNGDGFGDECDDDDDNDGLVDWIDSDDRGDVTYDDDNDGNTGAGCLLGTDPGDDGPSWDTACDGVRDFLTPAYCAEIPDLADGDGDGLRTRWEVYKWGTSDGSQNTDILDQGDCDEVMDVNGDGIVRFIDDLLNWAKAIQVPSFGKDGDFDLDGDDHPTFLGDLEHAAKLIQLAPGAGGCIP